VTPFDTLWAGDLLDQVGFGAGDRVLDLAAAGGRGGGLTLPFPEPDDLRAVLAGAGFDAIRVRTAHKAVRFPSVAEFLRRYLSGSPAGAATAHLPERDRRKVLADLETALGPWVDTAGLRVVTEANIAVAAR
jgi:hypothetical protein